MNDNDPIHAIGCGCWSCITPHPDDDRRELVMTSVARTALRIALAIIMLLILLGLAHMAERAAHGATVCHRTHCLHDGAAL